LHLRSYSSISPKSIDNYQQAGIIIIMMTDNHIRWQCNIKEYDISTKADRINTVIEFIVSFPEEILEKIKLRRKQLQ
jgi:hypothetical protein